MQQRPSTTLCPICTRLSIIEPEPITVSCPDPRSIVVLAPISTSSPIRTRPSCGTLIGAFGSGANPNPSWPIRTPGCSTTREPIRQWLSVTLARDPAIVADLDPGGDHRICADAAAPAEPHAALDDDIRADLAILGHDGRRIDDRRRRAAGDHIGRGIESLRGERIGLVGLLADEERHAGRRPFGGLFIDKGGTGARADKCFDVFPVFEKADVCRVPRSRAAPHR